jgi:hypothetical protein
MEYHLSEKQKSFSLFLKGNGFIRVLWNSFEFKDVYYPRNSIGINRWVIVVVVDWKRLLRRAKR